LQYGSEMSASGPERYDRVLNVVAPLPPHLMFVFGLSIVGCPHRGVLVSSAIVLAAVKDDFGMHSGLERCLIVL